MFASVSLEGYGFWVHAGHRNRISLAVLEVQEVQPARVQDLHSKARHNKAKPRDLVPHNLALYHLDTLK